VSGTVVGADGNPLPGVTVLVKGTGVGAVTDVDGNFRLNVTGADPMLVVSFVGFITREVALGDQTKVEITLTEDTTQLEEVVVTAVGIEREKKALGYAVASVSGENLAQRSEPDPLRAMQGKMPGVNIQAGGGAPGQATKINIRGMSSLTGNTQPLFVVDGIPFDNSVNATTSAAQGTQFSNRAFDIDPNNIEAVTVLKGAAASALYGSRATNGVVLITTKAARKNSKKGLEVSFNTSYNVEQISGVPDYQDIYTQGSAQQYNGGFIGNWGAPFPNHVDRINEEYGTSYTKIYGQYPDGTPYPEGTAPHPLVGVPYGSARYRNVFPELLDENGNAIPVVLEPHDIIGGFFQTGHVAENAISITSGGEKASLTAGFSRMDNDGIVQNMSASRTGLNFGGNAQLDNGLFISGNVNYVNTKQQTPQSGASAFTDYYGGGTSSIYSRIFYLPRNFNLNEYPFENPVDGSNVFYRALDNPRWIAQNNLYNSDVNRAYGNINLSYDVNDWLNVLVKGGVNTYSEGRRNVIRPGGVSVPVGEVWTEDLTYTEQDYNAIITVKHDFNEDISFRGMFGANANQRERDRRRMTGNDLNQPGFNLVDATTSQLVNWDLSYLQRFYAVYSDMQFGFKDFWFVNLVGRNDWTSTLPSANNSYFYPGISTSLILSDLVTTPAQVGYIKLRASAARVGNEPSPYQTATNYFFNQAFVDANGTSYKRATRMNTLGNPDLKPEFTTEVELGFDVQAFRNRLGINFTYFDRTSTDQITTGRIPASSGYNSQIFNVGELNNKGIEVGLDVTPVQLENGFRWNTFFAFTRIRSEVVDAGPSGSIFIGGPGSTFGTIHQPGFQYGQIFGSVNARDDEGNLLINKQTGMPFALPQSEIIGDPNPDFTLGITNTFSFKGFTLNALLDWTQGGELYSFTAASLLLRGQLESSLDREGLRVVPGVYGDPQTFEPILDENGQKMQNTTGVTAFDYHFSNGFGAYGQDEVNIYDATVVRLRELSLGYNFPLSLLERTPFGSARINFTGRNLWFNAPNMLEGLNMDPEVLSEGAASNVQGFEYGATPTTRRFGVNLNLTF
jgi:TonB-linked SusC/RagA family outer membrane protein